jgi:hypothetical protein
MGVLGWFDHGLVVAGGLLHSSSIPAVTKRCRSGAVAGYQSRSEALSGLALMPVKGRLTFSI